MIKEPIRADHNKILFDATGEIISAEQINDLLSALADRDAEIEKLRKVAEAAAAIELKPSDKAKSTVDGRLLIKDIIVLKAQALAALKEEG